METTDALTLLLRRLFYDMRRTILGDGQVSNIYQICRCQASSASSFEPAFVEAHLLSTMFPFLRMHFTVLLSVLLTSLSTMVLAFPSGLHRTAFKGETNSTETIVDHVFDYVVCVSKTIGGKSWCKWHESKLCQFSNPAIIIPETPLTLGPLLAGRRVDWVLSSSESICLTS